MNKCTGPDGGKGEGFMGMFSQSIEVACGPDGQPHALTWAGRSYSVCAEPVRWFERRQWWVEEGRAPLGSGPGLVDHEIWRVQVKITDGPPAGEDPAGEDTADGLRTLDISRHLGSGRWRLLRLHDALRPHEATRKTA